MATLSCSSTREAKLCKLFAWPQGRSRIARSYNGQLYRVWKTSLHSTHDDTATSPGESRWCHGLDEKDQNAGAKEGSQGTSALIAGWSITCEEPHWLGPGQVPFRSAGCPSWRSLRPGTQTSLVPWGLADLVLRRVCHRSWGTAACSGGYKTLSIAPFASAALLLTITSSKANFVVGRQRHSHRSSITCPRLKHHSTPCQPCRRLRNSSLATNPVSRIVTALSISLTTTVTTRRDELSSNTSTSRRSEVCSEVCTCSHPFRGFIESPAYQSSYVPGAITMEERYMNLLLVMNEATMRFPESSSTR